jgi:hypothetical protein
MEVFRVGWIRIGTPIEIFNANVDKNVTLSKERYFEFALKFQI